MKVLFKYKKNGWRCLCSFELLYIMNLHAYSRWIIPRWDIFHVVRPPEDIIYVYSWNNNELYFNYSNLFNQQHPCRESGYQPVILESRSTYNCEYESTLFYARNYSTKSMLVLYIALPIWAALTILGLKWSLNGSHNAAGSVLDSSSACSLQLMCCCMAVSCSVAINTPVHLWDYQPV